jgi:hypothetical protein
MPDVRAFLSQAICQALRATARLRVFFVMLMYLSMVGWLWWSCRSGVPPVQLWTAQMPASLLRCSRSVIFPSVNLPVFSEEAYTFSSQEGQVLSPEEGLSSDTVLFRPLSLNGPQNKDKERQ